MSIKVLPAYALIGRGLRYFMLFVILYQLN
nr:MAG TPA: hypothetical protein [Caudoviricetes sp.]